MAQLELQSLHDTVYDQALVWVNSLKTEQKERIEGHFGPMPGKDSVLQVHTIYKVTLFILLSNAPFKVSFSYYVVFQKSIMILLVVMQNK